MASPTAMSASSDEVLHPIAIEGGAPIAPPGAPRDGARKRRRKLLPRDFAGVLVAVIGDPACASGPMAQMWRDAQRMPRLDGQQRRLLFGLALVAWRLCPTAGLTANEQILRDGAGRRRPCNLACVYDVREFCAIDPASADGIHSLATAQRVSGGIPACVDFGRKLATPLTEWLVVSFEQASLLMSGSLRALAVVSVGHRNRAERWPLTSRPSRAALRSAMQEASGTAPGAPRRFPCDVPASAIAARKLAGRDPLEWLRFLSASRFLRDGRNTTKCMEAMVEAFFPGRATELSAELGSERAIKALCKSSLAIGRPRLDITCMLMERREWTVGRWFNAAGRSIHPTLDSSPSSGRDIFGCILDVFMTNDSYEEIILPGATLGHGYTSTTDKTVAFLWALFLVCGGSSLETMEAVLCDMRSMCSDFGVEAGIAAMPNILPQWASAMGLRVSDRFSKFPRLFPFIVLVPDFNHLASNIIKRVFTASPRWPAFLSHMRALCKFFRNAEYRSTMRQAMTQRGLPAMANALKHWSASLAHWRYETIYEVLRDLLKVRGFCSEQFDRRLIGLAQEQHHINEVAAACRDMRFWRWVAAMFPYAERYQSFRQWARGCACHSSELQAKFGEGGHNLAIASLPRRCPQGVVRIPLQRRATPRSVLEPQASQRTKISPIGNLELSRQKPGAKPYFPWVGLGLVRQSAMSSLKLSELGAGPSPGLGGVTRWGVLSLALSGRAFVQGSMARESGRQNPELGESRM